MLRLFAQQGMDYTRHDAPAVTQRYVERCIARFLAGEPIDKAFNLRPARGKRGKSFEPKELAATMLKHVLAGSSPADAKRAAARAHNTTVRTAERAYKSELVDVHVILHRKHKRDK